MWRMTNLDFIGRGFRFPIKVNARGRLEWSDGPDRIRDAIWIIIKTALGERLMRPKFGAGVDDFVFQANSAVNRSVLQGAIKSALLEWEPRIDLDDVLVNSASELESSSADATERQVLGDARELDNQVLVTIQYRLRTTNELFNVVFPFFLEEGVS
jgi:phage baseplate assembly protein W